jgi:hypothetical protein
MQILLEYQSKITEEMVFSSGLGFNWTGSELDSVPNLCEHSGSNKSLAL